MAKDDYFVIVSKILVYLYCKLRHEQGLDDNYIRPMSKDFPINEFYLVDVLEMLINEGLIMNEYFDWVNHINDFKITFKGIEYMSTNEIIVKVCKNLKESESIFFLFNIVAI